VVMRKALVRVQVQVQVQVLAPRRQRSII